MRVRSRFVLPLLAAALSVGIAPALIAPPMAHAAGGDDTPTLLNVKGEHESGDDESSFDKLRDAYYWSRLLAGDDELTEQQAAALRTKASAQAGAIASESVKGNARGGTWQAQGPNPIVQNGRTTNNFEAVSGRIGALAIRNDGTIILGAAQGGDLDLRRRGRHLDLADQGRRHPVGRRPGDRPEQRLDRLHGLRRGRPLRRLLLRRRRLQVHRRRGHVDPRLRPSSPGSPPRPSPSTRRTRTTCMRRRSAAAAATTARPPRPSRAYGIWESTDGGANWTLRKGTTTRSHGATDLVMDPQNPKNLWASFWGDAIYKSTDGGVTWSSSLGNLPHRQLPRGRHPVRARAEPPCRDRPTRRSTPASTGSTTATSTTPRASSRASTAARRGPTPPATRRPGPTSVVGYCGTQCFYDNVVKPDPTNPNVVYALGVYGYNNSPQSGGIYRSVDGGAHWLSLGYDLHPDFHAIAFQPNDTKHIAIGNDGGVWQSHNQGGRLAAGRAAEHGATGRTSTAP